jgi:hypothetical protein
MTLVTVSAPRYGTWRISSSAERLNTSPARWLVLPSPAEAKFSVPGFALASAISSPTVAAGKLSGTISTSGTTATCATPARSATGSKVSPLLSGPTAEWPFEVSITLYPSTGPLATLKMPGTPGRFSTITLWFH